MSQTPRHERARRIAAWYAEQVRQVAPEGIGSWAEAWELVAAPSDAFLDALNGWERAGDGSLAEGELRAAVEAAGAGMVEAWRLAAVAWERAGRPQTWERETVGVA